MDTTERLVLDLPAELVAELRARVASGEFASESELVRASLAHWCGQQSVEEPPLDELRAFIAEGLADADAGRLVDADEVFDELESRYQAMLPERDR